VYYAILGRAGIFNPADVRQELGDAFVNLALPSAGEAGTPAMDFVEL
jgi:hypothetical protein